MNWTLPVAGGLYDQDPELLDFWYTIISEKAKHDKDERDKQDRKSGKSRKGGKGMLGSAGPKNVKGPKVAGRFNDGY